MNQPDKPVPARGARPQLFGDPGAGKTRQPAGGAGILATIDGGMQRPSHGRRDAVPAKRVLAMAGLAILVVAIYFMVKFGMPAPSSSRPAAAALPVAAVASPTDPYAPASGVASIENVVPPTTAAASTPEPTSGSNISASLSTLQQTLSSAEKNETVSAAKNLVAGQPAAPNKGVASKGTAALQHAAAPAQKNLKAKADSDAELIAAMLPHLKRRGLGPTSPAYEKRCGHLVGDPAVDCWNKFCSEREGVVDAVCPSRR